MFSEEICSHYDSLLTEIQTTNPNQCVETTYYTYKTTLRERNGQLLISGELGLTFVDHLVSRNSKAYKSQFTTVQTLPQ